MDDILCTELKKEQQTHQRVRPIYGLEKLVIVNIAINININIKGDKDKMENKTTIKVPKKYQGMIELIEQDSEGYWAYANEGYIFEGMGCRTAHEYTQKDLVEMIRTLKEDETEEQESSDEVQTADEPVKKEESYISEIQIIVDIDSYVQGIHLNQQKTYSNDMDKDDKEGNEERLEQLLYVALYRLDENVTIDTLVTMNDGTQENIGRIIHKWGKIELRKPVGTVFETQEEYEREGYWKKRIKDFINNQLEEIEQPNQEKQTYWYEYIHRGFSIGCQPKGFVDHDESKGEFGWVAYDRKLTEKETSDYELRPVE